jgi:hypothetical protein
MKRRKAIERCVEEHKAQIGFTTHVSHRHDTRMGRTGETSDQSL